MSLHVYKSIHYMQEKCTLFRRRNKTHWWCL